MILNTLQASAEITEAAHEEQSIYWANNKKEWEKPACIIWSEGNDMGISIYPLNAEGEAHTLASNVRSKADFDSLLSKVQKFADAGKCAFKPTYFHTTCFTRKTKEGIDIGIGIWVPSRGGQPRIFIKNFIDTRNGDDIRDVMANLKTYGQCNNVEKYQ